MKKHHAEYVAGLRPWRKRASRTSLWPRCCSSSLQAIVFLEGLLIFLQGTPYTHAHGRLIEPPSRSSLFRFGYPVEANYLDNQLFCGGFQLQWETYGGRCGVCGDPWDGPRENEAGGKYARGIIVRRYRPASVIAVQVELTAAHRGWFEFRLCPNNNPRRRVTHECLNNYLLYLDNGHSTRYQVGDSSPGLITIGLQLPSGLTCSQCVLQWKYNAGNSWGVDESGNGCVGCGPQEQFYGCADIAIGNGTDFDPDFYEWPWPSGGGESGGRGQGDHFCVVLTVTIALWSLARYT